MVVATVIVHAFRADAYRVRRPVAPAAAAAPGPEPSAGDLPPVAPDADGGLIRRVPGRESGSGVPR